MKFNHLQQNIQKWRTSWVKYARPRNTNTAYSLFYVGAKIFKTSKRNVCKYQYCCKYSLIKFYTFVKLMVKNVIYYYSFSELLLALNLLYMGRMVIFPFNIIYYGCNTLTKLGSFWLLLAKLLNKWHIKGFF